MNERIKELLAQCTDSQMTKPWPLVDTEKFAELLVQECADLFEVEFGDEKLTGNDVSWLLKKHFGVKE